MISGPIGTLLPADAKTLVLSILVMAALGFAAMLLMARTQRRGAPA
jgi:hypothetical protein